MLQKLSGEKKRSFQEHVFSTSQAAAMLFLCSILRPTNLLVVEVWRLSQETTELGLWDRIYPREDAGDGELTLRALTILARYALAARPALTKQHDSTRYERGRSLRTVLDEQWPESRHRWPTVCMPLCHRSVRSHMCR